MDSFQLISESSCQRASTTVNEIYRRPIVDFVYIIYTTSIASTITGTHESKTETGISIQRRDPTIHTPSVGNFNAQLIIKYGLKYWKESKRSSTPPGRNINEKKNPYYHNKILRNYKNIHLESCHRKNSNENKGCAAVRNIWPTPAPRRIKKNIYTNGVVRFVCERIGFFNKIINRWTYWNGSNVKKFLIGL